MKLKLDLILNQKTIPEQWIFMSKKSKSPTKIVLILKLFNQHSTHETVTFDIWYLK